MIPIKQTITNTEYGNCLQACIASVLEKKLDYVPNFMLYEHIWWESLILWLGVNGYNCEYIVNTPPNDGVFYVTSLKYACHGEGISHAVVMKDCEIVHNPWVDNSHDDDNFDIHGYYKLIRK